MNGFGARETSIIPNRVFHQGTTCIWRRRLLWCRLLWAREADIRGCVSHGEEMPLSRPLLLVGPVEQYHPSTNAPSGWWGGSRLCHQNGPIASSTTSTTAKASATAEPDPEPSPFEHGEPMKNERNCYNSSRDEDHERADNGLDSFCKSVMKEIEDSGIAPENFLHERKYEFPIKNNRSPTEFVISLEVFPGCEWVSDMDECKRYLLAPIDGCNCGGENGKQGGTVSNNCLSWRIDPNSK